ncbi:hypothetical protein [Xanthovirga aplysinae]|uniref:hypothetical protein n=1 Tax=Xanthovirga aplysinae TaxID=2529853 RepID=UPI0012BD5DF0|nr:hypothetical protein [Xanthovirga aplysinae]MTI31599.1 hypothetical protein [Xanthovirga aplysinae]
MHHLAKKIAEKGHIAATEKNIEQIKTIINREITLGNDIAHVGMAILDHFNAPVKGRLEHGVRTHTAVRGNKKGRLEEVKTVLHNYYTKGAA